MSGDEIEMIDTLSVQYSGKLLAVMHDKASVNNTAMRTMSIVVPSTIDVESFSHMLDLVGEKFAFLTWLNYPCGS